MATARSALRDRPRGRARGTKTALGVVAIAAALLSPADGGALAQETSPLDALATGSDAPLYLEADRLVYDFDNDRVSAVGNVAIFHRGYAVFARRVTLERRTDRFFAEGGVRLEEPDGTIVTAERLALSEDLREGFASGIRVDTVVRSRFAATSAERVDGDSTVFHDGVYTACSSCLARPDKPPTWQIKARTIIHDEKERTVRYEDATFELYGVPIAYLPFFSHPDPTVERKTGFLVPEFIYTNKLGAGARVPYHWVLSPSTDVTVGATGLTRQGLLADVEWRQRLVDGAYDIRLAGIFQADPDAFRGTSGDRDFRGSLVSNGDFRINQAWSWGWRAVLTTDRSFLDDYDQPGTEGEALQTGVNTLFLTGLGERTYADVRGYGFRVLQEDFRGGDVLDPPNPFTPVGQDLQDKQPIVHPVIDYDGVLDSSLAGGELAWQLNLTSLTRRETDAFGVIRNGRRTAGFRGVEGTFSRASARLAWRRQLIGPLGQVLTPYAGAQGDVFLIDDRDRAVTALENGVVGRGMPWIGMQYRWPWVAAAGWGTQTMEPIAQITVRPDETAIGEIPNEDSQSVVFEDSSLFDVNKFSGFDRFAGGTRIDLGFRYTVQTFGGGFVSALVGQSFQLAGRNSYAVPDIMNSSFDSGLQTAESDYVAGLYLANGGGLQLSAQGRFDEDTLDVKRAQVQTSGRSGPVSAQVLYTYLRQQPDLGVTRDRQELQAAASLRVLPSLRVFGQVRYDVEDNEVIRDGIGIGWDDDSFSWSLSYAEDRTGDDDEEIDRRVFFRVGFRTLADLGVSGSFGE